MESSSYSSEEYSFLFDSDKSNLISVRENLKIYKTECCIHNIESHSCDIFQLIFYLNLFEPLEHSKLFDEKTLSKNTMKNCLMNFSC